MTLADFIASLSSQDRETWENMEDPTNRDNFVKQRGFTGEAPSTAGQWVAFSDMPDGPQRNLPEELRQYARQRQTEDGMVWEIPKAIQDHFDQQGAAGNPAYAPYYHAPKGGGGALSGFLSNALGGAKWSPFSLEGPVANTAESLADRYAKPLAMVGGAATLGAVGAGLAGVGGAASGYGAVPGSLAELNTAAALEGTGAVAGGVVPSAAGVAPIATAGAAGAGLGEGIGSEAYFAEGPATQAPAMGTPEWDIAQGYPPPADLPPQLPDWYGPDVLKTGAGAAAGTTALGRLLDLGQTGQDILSVGGPLLGAGLGYLGADKQSDAYRDVANQYFNIGAPYRGELEESYQPGFDLASQPGYGDAFNRMADVSARSYSSKFGNPAGSPSAQGGILGDVWNQSYLPALSNYRGQLGQFGGLGLNTSGSASMGGAGVAGGGLDAIGYGLGSVMNPQMKLEDLLKQLGTTGQNRQTTTIMGNTQR